MNSVRPSGALKAQARDHLTGHYATAISALLLIQCIVFLSTTISTGFADTTTLTGMILSLLISFILQLLAGIFTESVQTSQLMEINGLPFSGLMG